MAGIGVLGTATPPPSDCALASVSSMEDTSMYTLGVPPPTCARSFLLIPIPTPVCPESVTKQVAPNAANRQPKTPDRKSFRPIRSVVSHSTWVTRLMPRVVILFRIMRHGVRDSDGQCEAKPQAGPALCSSSSGRRHNRTPGKPVPRAPTPRRGIPVSLSPEPRCRRQARPDCASRAGVGERGRTAHPARESTCMPAGSECPRG